MQEQMLSAEQVKNYFFLFITHLKERIDRELADKHQKGEIQVLKPARKAFVPEDMDNIQSQAPRKKIALSANAITAVKCLLNFNYNKKIKLLTGENTKYSALGRNPSTYFCYGCDTGH
jgi:hypothetical protein